MHLKWTKKVYYLDISPKTKIIITTITLESKRIAFFLIIHGENLR